MSILWKMDYIKGGETTLCKAGLIIKYPPRLDLKLCLKQNQDFLNSNRNSKNVSSFFLFTWAYSS